MTASIPTFSTLLQRFFTQRLMQQKQVSPHTISSYRDTFRLLLRFAKKRLGTPPDRLAFEKLDAPFITAFLNELEETRGVSAQTPTCASLRSDRSSASPPMKCRRTALRYNASWPCRPSGSTAS
jgi:hypothetical protein